MRVVEYPILIVNGNMDANITSPGFLVTQGWLVSIQAHWTGAPVGSLELLISNDNITYSVYTGSSTPVSGPGNFLWNCVAAGYNYVQLQYTFVSGTGVLNATINYKGII
jgi:hypothetical protein